MSQHSSDSDQDNNDSDQEEEEEENSEITPLLSESVRINSKCCRMKAEHNNGEFIELESAFRGILKTYFWKNNITDLKDICPILLAQKKKMQRLIENMLLNYKSLKFNIVVEASYEKPLSDEQYNAAFKTKNVSVFLATSIHNILTQMIFKICQEENEFQTKKSGWSLLSVDGIMLRFSRYRPIGGGSSYLPLPKRILAKRAILNPRNLSNNKCFKYAILARYVSGFHCERVDKRYKKLNNMFNFNKIVFPMQLKQITKFEKNNPGVSVNVYGLNEAENVYPLRVCDIELVNHFDLLLISDNKGRSHYTYIKDLSRLINSQLSKHMSKTILCKRCFTHYQGVGCEQRLENHKLFCNDSKTKFVKPIMPECDNEGVVPILKFCKPQNSIRLPVVFYADFECLLVKNSATSTIKRSKYTEIYQTHVPMSYCVYVVVDSKTPECVRECLPKSPHLYRGKNASSNFMEYIISCANMLGAVLKENNFPMYPLTEDEQFHFDTALRCELCNIMFTDLCVPVRDHCHISGQFRNVLCSKCNLNRQNQTYISVIIHNGSNYDNHFIIRELGCDEERIDVIPHTSEKLITFTKQTKNKIKLRFIDSCKFLNESLSILVENLPKGQFFHTSKIFPDKTDFNLICSKQKFPYDFVDSWDKLEMTNLPPKKNFYNQMTGSGIKEEDYKKAQLIWSHFGCQTLGDYSDLYLLLDTVLLSDVYEAHRTLSLSHYNLDPCHYFTLPGFSFDAMLKFTKVELELLLDYDMYIFLENGIRGGITTCPKKYAQSNNPFANGVNFDQSKETSHLMYIDANALYSLAMSAKLPKSNFHWMASEKLKDYDVFMCPDDSDVGYILECDIVYPAFLHDLHNDLPFLPDRQRLEYQKRGEKLCTDFHSKTNYVCYYKNLKQALLNKLILLKVHRILCFNQTEWLKPYIEFNMCQKKNAKNAFEKEYFKNLSNSTFGKCIENIRAHIKLELVNNEKRLDKLIAKPTFKNRIIYNENLCAVELEKDSILFNKPIYAGFCILEISKIVMYNFFYNILKDSYKKINLLYMDTDSFFLEIFTDNVYKDFSKPPLKNYIDLSTLPKENKWFSDANKGVLGCFKDEACGVPIVEFIGLRPKLYSFKTVNDKYLEEIKGVRLKKAKGVTKSVLKHHITYDDFKDCLLNLKRKRRNILTFRSKHHIVHTVSVNKLALDSNDDKRKLSSDNINTTAFGHYKLE